MPSTFRSLVTLGSLLGAMVGLSPACGARTGLDRATDAPEQEPECGDAVINGTEECDSGPQVVGDACLDTCVFAFCGDGELRAGEACDDGNNVNGDGCEGDCSLPSCGNGVLDPGEECDVPDPAVCTPNCTIAVCGDGFLAPSEECDAGPANGLTAALSVVSAGVTTDLLAISIDQPVGSYYAFDSASSHTGLEEAFKAMLQPVLDPSDLFLVTIHNIDQDTSGIETGDGEVHQRFTGLPPGATVFLADDKPDEFSQAADGSAIGDWEFHNNTDGGVIGPLTFPGEWVIQVNSDFVAGIDSYVVEHGGFAVPLDMLADAFIVAHATPSPCTPDCTLPRCGDGFVDGGEVCDDGDNGDPGGVCNASCSAFN